MVYVRSLLALLLLSVPSFAEVAWVKSFDEALKQAGAQKKFVVLDMSASWCGYCRRMAREVYPDPEFVEYSRNQVFVRLFADTDAEGTQLSRRFSVRAFPTIVVLDAQAHEVGRLVGAHSRRLIRELRELTGRATGANR